MIYGLLLVYGMNGKGGRGEGNLIAAIITILLHNNRYKIVKRVSR